MGVAQHLQHCGITVHTSVAQGGAADTIVATAREFDLVAMATHGRSGVGRWVYGSVADRVLRGATIPVLLVRAGVSDATAHGSTIGMSPAASSGEPAGSEDVAGKTGRRG